MDFFDWFCWVAIAVIVGLMGIAIYESAQHDIFLEEHGCQLLAQAPTGRHHYVGKLLETEYVYVYECVDGTRTEVH